MVHVRQGGRFTIIGSFGSEKPGDDVGLFERGLE